MTPREVARQWLSRGGRILGPMALTVGPYLIWAAFARWMSLGQIPGGLWVWLLLPPGLAMEWVAYRYLDAPAVDRERLRARILLGLRVTILCVYFYVVVGRTAMVLDDPDIYASLVGYWPHVGMFPLIASPVLGVLAVIGMAVAYWRLTLHRRGWRLTTTVLIPWLAAMGLFHFYYAYPTSPLHIISMSPEPPVERVFPFDDSDSAEPDMEPPFYARTLHVADDEKKVVASYGRTFFVHEGPHLRWIDLETGQARVRRGQQIRRFQSTCSDRLYAGPWNGSTMLELDVDGLHIREIELPLRINDAKVEEINFILHDCETHRVIVGINRNPVLFVWNTRLRALEETVNLMEYDGFRLSDSLGCIRRNPKDGAIFVGMHGRWNLVEIDPVSWEPRRFSTFPELAIDMEFSKDGSWLYISAFMTGTVWKMDPETLEIVATFDAPTHSRRLSPTTDGRSLIVLGYLSGEIVSLDTTTGEELKSFRVGPRAEGLFVSRNYAWVSAATGLFRVPLEALHP